MSVRRWLFTLTALLAAFAGAPVSRTAQAQFVTVTVQSVDDAVSQFRTLAGAFGEDEARPVLNELDKLEKTDILNGVDKTRPVAATFELLRKEGAGPLGLPCLVVFIPVADQNAFIESLKKTGVGVDDLVVDGFTNRLLMVGTGAPPFFVLADPPKGYMVATNVPENPAKLRAIKPAELRPAKAGLITAVSELDKIPPTMKQGVLQGVEAQMTAQRQKKDSESDAEYKARIAGMETVNQAFTSIVRDSQKLQVNLNVNPKSQRLSMAIELDAKPNTDLSKAFASVGSLKSQFRGISPEAGVCLSAVLPITESLRDVVRDGIKRGREEAKKEDDEEDARMLNLVLDALEPTLTGDRVDGCVIMDFPVEPEGDKSGPNVVLFGFALKESKKLETALRESASKGAKPDSAEEIKLDADKADDGTAIHRVKLAGDQLKPDEFGEPYMFVAFPEGAALVAVGGKGLPVIKQALAGLKKPAGASDKAPAQVELDVSAKRFSRMYQDDAANSQTYRQAAAAAFAGKNAGKDHLQLGLTVEPTSVRLTLESDLPVLNFLTQVGAKQK